MALVLSDVLSGQPVAIQLDDIEARAVANLLDGLLRRGGFGTVLPASLGRVYAAAHEVAECGLSAPDMTADGHDSTASPGADDILDVMQVAHITGKSERQTRRLLSQRGQKVSGRWAIRRADLEKVE